MRSSALSATLARNAFVLLPSSSPMASIAAFALPPIALSIFSHLSASPLRFRLNASAMLCRLPPVPAPMSPRASAKLCHLSPARAPSALAPSAMFPSVSAMLLLGSLFRAVAMSSTFVDMLPAFSAPRSRSPIFSVIPASVPPMSPLTFGLRPLASSLRLVGISLPSASAVSRLLTLPVSVFIYFMTSLSVLRLLLVFMPSSTPSSSCACCATALICDILLSLSMLIAAISSSTVRLLSSGIRLSRSPEMKPVASCTGPINSCPRLVLMLSRFVCSLRLRLAKDVSAVRAKSPCASAVACIRY